VGVTNTEKDKTFHNADEIMSASNEASIPIGRLRDFLNRHDITTLPEFRIKRVQRPRQEEYKAIVEMFNGPNVASRHKGLAFRATYQNGVANAAWQAIAIYNCKYHDELKNTVYHLLPQRKKNKFKHLGSWLMSPRCLWCIIKTCLQDAQ
jgi:hypothetical protein